MNHKNEAVSCGKYPAIVFLVLLVGMFFASIATIFWGSDRTLGFGDEGVYFLAARYPDEIRQNVSSVYAYTGFVFKAANYDVVIFRLFGVVLVCASAFVFWFGFYSFVFERVLDLHKETLFKVISLVFVELGALLHYQWFYMTPNYNTLIGIAISVFAGAALYGFSLIENWRERKKSVALSFAFGGFGVGLALFVKIPAGVCFVLLFFMAMGLWRGVSVRHKCVSAMSFVLGVCFWFLVHFVFVQSPDVWWHMFKEGWRLYQTLGVYSPHSKVVMYALDLLFFLYSALKVYWPCYIIMSFGFLFNIIIGRGSRYFEAVNVVAIAAVLLVAALLSVKAGVFISERKAIGGAIPFFAIFHLAWILLLSIVLAYSVFYSSKCNDVSFGEIGKPGANFVIVFLLLFFLPIAGSLGTQNPLYNVPLCHAATWFGAILMLLAFVKLGGRAKCWAVMFSVLSIAAFTASQIIQGYIFDPQTSGVNLLFHKRVIEVGSPVSVIKLDNEEYNLVQEFSTKAKSHGFKAGDDVIAFNFIPGLVFALGGKSPGHPAFIMGSAESEAYSDMALQFAEAGRLKKSYILLDVAPERVQDLLARRGINFPGDYVLIAYKNSMGKDYSFWKPVD